MWRQMIQVMTFTLIAVTEVRASGQSSECWEIVTITLEFYVQVNSHSGWEQNKNIFRQSPRQEVLKKLPEHLLQQEEN